MFLLTSIKLELEKYLQPISLTVYSCVFSLMFGSSLFLKNNISPVILFHVDEVQLFSHGEILGKVKHNLETLKTIV